MQLTEVFERMRPVYGTTSLIAGVSGGDLKSVGDPGSKVPVLLAEAEKSLEAATKGRDECQSDASYWGWQSQISYWRMICNVLRAAEITGPDNLPDVSFPDLENTVVMDAQSRMEKWGEKVLSVARATRRG